MSSAYEEVRGKEVGYFHGQQVLVDGKKVKLKVIVRCIAVHACSLQDSTAYGQLNTCHTYTQLLCNV